MPQIIPIRDLRNTSEISELVNNTDEPIFVTKNGYGDMVVMSMEAYEKKLAKIELYGKLIEAKIQADNGDLLDGESVLAELRKRYVK